MIDSLKDPSKIADALVAAVGQAGPQVGLLGSRAGTIARSVDSKFNPRAYGAASMRDFIARHVKQLRVIGLSGSDPIYGLESWQATTAVTPETRSETRGSELWRIWVSPMNPFALAIRKDTGAVRALPKEAALASDEVKVEPLSIEKHKRVARNFLEEKDIQQKLRDTLNAALESSSVWWQQWTRLLRAESDELAKMWFDYRREGLLNDFEATLEESGVSGQALVNAKVAIATAQVVKRPTRLVPLVQAITTHDATSHVSPASRAPAMEPSPAPTSILSVVQQVVSRMGEHELRSLSLPVGLVLDVLRATRVER